MLRKFLVFYFILLFSKQASAESCEFIFDDVKFSFQAPQNISACDKVYRMCIISHIEDIQRRAQEIKELESSSSLLFLDFSELSNVALTAEEMKAFAVEIMQQSLGFGKSNESQIAIADFEKLEFIGRVTADKSIVEGE